MKELRYRILFLASWYPNRTCNVLGMFFKRKTQALSKLCDIFVLFVSMDRLLWRKL
jgi:hypothetical protein